MKHGFTLIELSIVLVIIGLIIGGILVGQDLIKAADIRSQISQLEKFNSAVHTFRTKYNYLPGDMPDPLAGQCGFITRGVNGDGNPRANGDELIDGQEPYDQYAQAAGEAIAFWLDLSTAQLIEGRFNATDFDSLPCLAMPGNDRFTHCWPKAVLNKAYIYVWSGGLNAGDGMNYYTIAQIDGGSTGLWTVEANQPGLTGPQAYAIDQKIDDGKPQTGQTRAMYVNDNVQWAPNAAVASANTCFDTTSGRYTVSFGETPNCALSIRFQ